MKDPVRLLDDPGAPAAVRELLRAGAPEPSAAQRAALWGSIEVAIGPGPGDGGGPADSGGASGGGAPGGASSSGAVTTGAASSATSGAVVASAVTAVASKGATSTLATWAALALAAGLSVGTAVIVGGPERRAEAPAPAASIAAVGPHEGDGATRRAEPPSHQDDVDGAQPAPSAASAVAPSDPEHGDPSRDDASPGVGSTTAPRAQGDARSAAPAPSAPTSASADAPATVGSGAHDEVAATAEARELLRAGHAARALEVLEAARVRYSGGVLVQERAALTVEALGRSGQADRAASLARAFLDAWPRSTHAARVRPWAR